MAAVPPGSALVECAEVEEGMACLDEATATALAGEAMNPISRAWSCCFLVSACEAVLATHTDIRLDTSFTPGE